MTPSPVVTEVLTKVAGVMASARDEWCLMGGAAALLHGVPIGQLDDIDVLLSPSDAQQVLPTHGIALTAGWRDGSVPLAGVQPDTGVADPSRFPRRLRSA